jgi:Secretion system C-terminal sorting domain
LLRSGSLNGSWTLLNDVRRPIQIDAAQFFNQLTALGTASTFNFTAATARYWVIGANTRSTSVRSRQEDASHAIRLVSCFPNPAQDVVQIRYTVRENTPLEITLYDLTGRKIGMLTQGTHIAGEYTLQIQTEMLATGVYMLRLQTPTAVTQELMRVVR